MPKVHTEVTEQLFNFFLLTILAYQPPLHEKSVTVVTEKTRSIYTITSTYIFVLIGC